MACGAEFKIIPDGEVGQGVPTYNINVSVSVIFFSPYGMQRAVKVFAYTSDPHKTAFEVGKRLFFRLGQGDFSNMNPCPMS